jgi:hypothetical protein
MSTFIDIGGKLFNLALEGEYIQSSNQAGILKIRGGSL